MVSSASPCQSVLRSISLFRPMPIGKPIHSFIRYHPRKRRCRRGQHARFLCCEDSAWMHRCCRHSVAKVMQAVKELKKLLLLVDVPLVLVRCLVLVTLGVS